MRSLEQKTATFTQATCFLPLTLQITCFFLLLISPYKLCVFDPEMSVGLGWSFSQLETLPLHSVARLWRSRQPSITDRVCAAGEE